MGKKSNTHFFCLVKHLKFLRDEEKIFQGGQHALGGGEVESSQINIHGGIFLNNKESLGATVLLVGRDYPRGGSGAC